MTQLVSNEDGTQSGPVAELGDSSCMTSIMISSFNPIYVKTNLANVSNGFMDKEGNRICNNLLWVRSGKDTSKLIY